MYSYKFAIIVNLGIWRVHRHKKKQMALHETSNLETFS